jgi:putative transcriptional regulator
MINAFESIKAGLEDAIAFAEGDATKGKVRIIELPKPDVSLIRKKTGLTQKEFAKWINVKVGTVQQWEQKRRSPKGPTTVLLTIIDQNPNIVQETFKKIAS